jgi:hypothetical protein
MPERKSTFARVFALSDLLEVEAVVLLIGHQRQAIDTDAQE